MGLSGVAVSRASENKQGGGRVVEAQIVPELIEGALQKRSVDAKNGHGARCGERARVCHGVLLGDAHIDELGTRGASELGREPHDIGRGGGDSDDTTILMHAIEQVGARNLGIGVVAAGACARYGRLDAGGDIERSHMMPALGICLRGGIAQALDAMDVQHDGMVASAQLGKHIGERKNVVTVFEITIIEPQRGEKIVGAGAVAGAQLGKVAVQAAVVFGDGLVVVVDDDDQVAGQLRSVVESLKRKTARQRAITDDGDDVIRLAGEVACLGETACETDRGRGVTHGEQVVLGFRGA